MVQAYGKLTPQVPEQLEAVAKRVTHGGRKMDLDMCLSIMGSGLGWVGEDLTLSSKVNFDCPCSPGCFFLFTFMCMYTWLRACKQSRQTASFRIFSRFVQWIHILSAVRDDANLCETRPELGSTEGIHYDKR